ncbi:hypothetical protein B0T25DRAFT_513098 [Lasiosphaeria hispida]|uniref:Uncharacterized protein n=1 Tax=Lasiosphaeria hispida TaxID=260671 RepID=A0AAJ0HU80_9PEZI|nr:hypothetical protein B0T25DRAFT_513098 [Lasiosphaeria hispida]
MAILNSDITLLVAEQTEDLESLSALMRTQRNTHGLISNNERSITKTRLASFGSELPLPPSGTILSSADHERERLPPYSFATLQEVLMRLRRIDVLFSPDAPLVQAIQASDSFMALPAPELAALVRGLKHATRLIDRLGDCAADVMVKREAEASRRQQHDGRSGVDAKTTDHWSSVREIHRAQMDLISTLPALELAYLSTLTDFAAMAYATVHPSVGADPAVWERLAAFREVLLRHGSLVLWAWLQPPSIPAVMVDSTHIPHNAPHHSWFPTDPMPTPDPSPTGSVQLSGATVPTPGPRTNANTPLARFVDQAVNNILEEIQLWESGGGAYEEEDLDNTDLMLPGLKKTINEVFPTASDRPAARVGIEMTFMILKEIKEHQ